MMNNYPIIIDNGSESCKIGLSGEEYPRYCFQSVVGYPNFPSYFSSMKYYVGDDAMDKKGLLHLKYPIKNGIVTDWSDMEKVWNYAFSECLIESNNQPVFLTQAQYDQSQDNEKMVEIFFEKFNVPSFYLGDSGLFSLYSQQKTTGVVVESGQDITYIKPIFEGVLQKNLIQKTDLGGKVCTNHFITLMKKQHKFTTSSEKEIAKHMKEKFCYVALDYEEELQDCASQASKSENFELPDGQGVTVKKKLKIQCPEILFNPKIGGLIDLGIHKLIYDTIMNCNVDIRQELFKNILLAGGNTMYPGMKQRLEKEITALAPQMKTKIAAPPGLERKISAWQGGSVVTSLSQFKHFWITKAEYQELGPENICRNYF